MTAADLARRAAAARSHLLDALDVAATRLRDWLTLAIEAMR